MALGLKTDEIARMLTVGETEISNNDELQVQRHLTRTWQSLSARYIVTKQRRKLVFEFNSDSQDPESVL